MFCGDQGLAFEAILNAVPSVDTFFLMGGTLTSYIMFRELEKAGTNLPRYIVFYCSVLIVPTEVRYRTSGPIRTISPKWSDMWSDFSFLVLQTGFLDALASLAATMSVTHSLRPSHFQI